jgi:hypothetical protein
MADDYLDVLESEDEEDDIDAEEDESVRLPPCCRARSAVALSASRLIS